MSVDAKDDRKVAPSIVDSPRRIFLEAFLSGRSKTGTGHIRVTIISVDDK